MSFRRRGGIDDTAQGSVFEDTRGGYNSPWNAATTSTSHLREGGSDRVMASEQRRFVHQGRWPIINEDGEARYFEQPTTQPGVVVVVAGLPALYITKSKSRSLPMRRCWPPTCLSIMG